IYGMDKAIKVFGPGVTVPPGEMVFSGVKKMHDDIAASARPDLPLIVSEFSAGPVAGGERDSLYMGPWIANVIRQCDGLAQIMAFWPFSDVFEEHGVPDAPFSDHSAREGRGLIAPDGIPKPSYVAFALLHRLGNERIRNSADDIILTKRADGSLAIALWNFVGRDASGADRTVRLDFRHISPRAQAVVYRLDQSHENTLGAYRAMGSPAYPTPAQVQRLWRVARIRPAEERTIEKNTLTIDLPPEGLAVVEVMKSR
ncbi:MAG: GH39 family glycosyl hydrolase, partial [Terriglobia bacterium]